MTCQTSRHRVAPLQGMLAFTAAHTYHYVHGTSPLVRLSSTLRALAVTTSTARDDGSVSPSRAAVPVGLRLFALAFEARGTWRTR